jgi:penicillin-binding protein 1A
MPPVSDAGFPPFWGDPEADQAVPRHGRRWRRLARMLRRVLAVVIVLSVLGAVMFGGLLLMVPSVADAPALARAFAHAHRAPYPGAAASSRFTAALVATEDRRFYSEPERDPFGTARLIVGALIGKPDRGGLYQQLAKMLYTPGRPGMTAEVEQVALAVKLAFSYPQSEILQMYAGIAYFGRGFYGLQEASCGYFGVPPAALNWPEAALLAGLISAPSADNPVTHFATARAREAHVLGRLVATGVLTPAQAGRAYRQPLRLERGQHASCAPR